MLFVDYFFVKVNELVWIKGVIELINLIVNGLVLWFKLGDKIVIFVIEYYVNIVLW